MRTTALFLAAALALVSFAAPARAQSPRGVIIPSTDGTELSGALYRSDDAAAPVVMLFHQGRGSVAEYERIAPRLVADGYHALAVDLRRGGDLFGVPNQTALAWNGPEPSYCDVYQDLESTMQFAREIGLRGPLVAWGSSYSAALVVRLGAEYPEQIAAVLAFSPASGEPMAGCEPEPWAGHVEVPWLVVRPQREVENAEYPWIAEQLELFRSAGADTYVAPDSRHGSSLLDPERNPSDPDPTWAVVDRFLTAHAPAPGRTVRIGSDGAFLRGEFQQPLTAGPHPAVLLLHNAAGARDEQIELAAALAARGIASLRVDLRGHGESTERGTFDPDDDSTRHLIPEGDRDVDAALRWIADRENVDATRIGIVGASYTGEEMAQAGPAHGVRAYVALSPGSFSDESIAAVDATGADWLFLRTEQELPFFDELFEAITDGSGADVRILPGRAHGTRMLDEPSTLALVADWLAERLGR